MASALIVHLPHDSTDIPAQYRDQFVLSDEELAKELLAMTDAHTAALFRVSVRRRMPSGRRSADYSSMWSVLPTTRRRSWPVEAWA